MTPEELVEQIGALVASNRDGEALDLSSKYLRELAPSMTFEQITRVADFAHMAQMAVDPEEWGAANRKPGVEAQASRPS